MKEYELLIDVISARWGKDRDMVGAKIIEGRPLDGEEVLVELRDPKLMESFKARAIFSSKLDEFPEWDRVWLTSQGRGRESVPLAIKIIERIEEEVGEVKVLPQRKLSLGERKGRLLEELLKDRERKEKEKGKKK